MRNKCRLALKIFIYYNDKNNSRSVIKSLKRIINNHRLSAFLKSIDEQQYKASFNNPSLPKMRRNILKLKSIQYVKNIFIHSY